MEAQEERVEPVLALEGLASVSGIAADIRSPLQPSV
jgi:hypothetical protein